METNHNKFDDSIRSATSKIKRILWPYHKSKALDDQHWVLIQLCLRKIESACKAGGVDAKLLLRRFMEEYEHPDDWDGIPDDCTVQLTRKRRHGKVSWGEMRKATEDE